MAPVGVAYTFMKINFYTTTNHHNGYGMTREYFCKYLTESGIILEPVNSGNDVTLILHIPPAIQHVNSRVKVLYTMLEGDTVPDSWYQYLQQATHILVPTQFVKETFKRAGFDSTVIPLGYDPDVFKYDEKIQRKETNKPYTFLHYEAFQDRKGWEDLLNAWNISGLAEEEFDAKLVLKTIKSYKEVYERLQSERIELPYNVKVITGEVPHESISHILASSDCFVFPSRGEGFSLPPIEAMATGLPTIISAGHSHLDYYNEDFMYGVKCDIKIPAVYPNWESQGSFVRCNYSALADTLRYVYEHQDEAKEKGKLASEYVKRYEYSNTANMIKEFLYGI